MYYVPVIPYHTNLINYWRTNSYQHPDYDFWSWVQQEWNARLDLRSRPERWFFEYEKDAVLFALKWS